jgi:hypothetical protein
VLFRHAPDHYRAMLRAAPGDAELVQLEHAGFGVSHDALGAALCESWGLDPVAVASVRHHVTVQGLREFPSPLRRRSLCALSAVVHALMHEPDALDAVVLALAAPAELDQTLVLRAARQVQDQLLAAQAHGRH